MFSVSESQLQDMSVSHVAQFKRDAAEHAADLAPHHAEAMGPGALDAFIAEAMDRAGAAGIEQQETTRRWIEFSLLWGIGFADDPSYPFVRQALDLPLPELQRMRALHRAAVSYIAESCAEDGAFFEAALQRFDAILQEKTPEDTPFEDARIGQALERLWPERAACVGAPAFVLLAAEGRQLATQAEQTSNRAVALYAGLALFLGTSCLGDPQYQWFFSGASDHDDFGDDLDALIGRTRAYIRTVLSNRTEGA